MVNKIMFASLAIIAIVSTAILQGSWTDRWNSAPREDLDRFAAAYDDIPKTIEVNGREWRGQETERDGERDARVLERAGATKIRTITYRDFSSNDAVTVMMVCGPSRHVSRHTPNHCFLGQGFTMSRPIKKFKIGDGEFYTAKFYKPGYQQRVFWGWNPAGTFEVPPGKPPVDARTVYGARLPLNKIYMIHQIPLEGQEPGESLCVEFGPKFMQIFNEAVFGSETDSETKDAGDA